jgi:hypothetical protein
MLGSSSWAVLTRLITRSRSSRLTPSHRSTSLWLVAEISRAACAAPPSDFDILGQLADFLEQRRAEATVLAALADAGVTVREQLFPQSMQRRQRIGQLCRFLGGSVGCLDALAPGRLIADDRQIQRPQLIASPRTPRQRPLPPPTAAPPAGSSAPQRLLPDGVQLCAMVRRVHRHPQQARRHPQQRRFLFRRRMRQQIQRLPVEPRAVGADARRRHLLARLHQRHIRHRQQPPRLRWRRRAHPRQQLRQRIGRLDIGVGARRRQRLFRSGLRHHRALWLRGRLGRLLCGRLGRRLGRRLLASRHGRNSSHPGAAAQLANSFFFSRPPGVT